MTPSQGLLASAAVSILLNTQTRTLTHTCKDQEQQGDQFGLIGVPSDELMKCSEEDADDDEEEVIPLIALAIQRVPAEASVRVGSADYTLGHLRGRNGNLGDER